MHPFRTAPIHASADQIRAANASLEQAVGPGYLPFEEECRRLISKGIKEVEEHPQLLASHPDEAVPMLAARIAQGSVKEFDVAALKRALEDADAAGHVWTPLLDVLATTRSWTYIIPPELRERCKVDGDFPSPSVRVANLQDWIVAQDDPEALDALLAFECPEIYTVVARHARVLLDRQVRQLLADSRATFELSQNRAAAAPHVDLIASVLVERIKSKQNDHINDAVAAFKELATRTDVPLYILEALAERVEKNEDNSWQIRDMFIQIPTTPTEILKKIWPRSSFSVSNHSMLRMLFHRNATLDFWKWVFTDSLNPRPILSDVLSHFEITPDQQLLLYDIFGGHRAHVPSFLTAHAPCIELLRRIARDHSHIEVRNRLVEIASARRDPEVAQVLASSRSENIAWKLITDTATDPVAFVQAYARASSSDPQRAQQHLRRRMEQNPCAVPAHWLFPFLRDPDQSTREKALTWLGMAGEGTDPTQRRSPQVRPRGRAR